MVHLYLGVAVLGTYLYFGLATLGTYLYLWLAALGMYLYLGLVALGMYLYLGLVALGIFSYQERYIFISRAGISSYTYKSMAGMVQKSTLGALGTNRCSGQATPGTRGVQIMTFAQFQLQNLYCYVSRHHTPRKSTIGILDLFLHKSIYKIKIKRDLSC